MTSGVQFGSTPHLRSVAGRTDGSPTSAAESARVLVVMYHYIRDRECLPRPGAIGPLDGIVGLSASEFAAQMDHLCRTLEPIDWPCFFAWRQGRAELPAKCFLLTFDDGLIEHAETVQPILESRGLHGVFFVSGSVLTGHRMLSVHATHMLLSTLGEPLLMDVLCRKIAALEEGPKLIQLLHKSPGNADHGAAAMYHYESPSRARLKYWLTVQWPILLRQRIIDELFEEHIGSSARWSRHWYLGWADLIRLQSAGHTIGGHGYAHEPYSRLTPEAIALDVNRVAGVLREGLGADRRPFSYPFGSCPEIARKAVMHAGFCHGFSTVSGWAGPGGDPLQWPRVDTIDVARVLHEFSGVM